MKQRMINFLIGFLGFISPAVGMEYHGQEYQDQFVNETFFNGKPNGVFLDIGAYDGVTISNTLFFEKELGWTGICVEPLPRAYALLKQNRTAVCLNCAIGSEDGFTHFCKIDAARFPELAMLSGVLRFFDQQELLNIKTLVNQYGGEIEIIEVPMKNINTLLIEHNLFNIDFLSMDVEGGELEILSSIDFNTFHIHIMTIENNAQEKNPKIQEFLESKGFRFVKRLKQDEVYENLFYKGTQTQRESSKSSI